MILLPRGTPVKENIDPGRVNLPDALLKLHRGQFTGYLRFETPGGTGILIFDQGRLLSALFDGEPQRLVAYEALARIFLLALSGDCRLDIYRISSELAMSIHALLHGDIRYRGQELKLIDIRSLLAEMKESRVSGCLRIYTDERIALIFYRQGRPLGFFHDGSTDLETTVDTSMSVARLPGAKVDVLIAKSPEEMEQADLLQAADLPALWQDMRNQVARQLRARKAQTDRSREQQAKEQQLKLQGLMRRIAEQHLGGIGASLADKEFEKVLAAADPLCSEALEAFYARVTRGAKLVAGPSRVATMLEEMRQAGDRLLGDPG